MRQRPDLRAAAEGRLPRAFDLCCRIGGVESAAEEIGGAEAPRAARLRRASSSSSSSALASPGDRRSKHPLGCGHPRRGRPDGIGTITKAEFRHAPGPGRGGGTNRTRSQTGRRTIRRTQENRARRTARLDLDPGRSGGNGLLGDAEGSRRRTGETQRTVLQIGEAVPGIPQRIALHQRGHRPPGHAADPHHEDPEPDQGRSARSQRTGNRGLLRSGEGRSVHDSGNAATSGCRQNKDKAKVEEAKQQLEKDDSVESWEKVAKEYSSDRRRKTRAGCRRA